MHIDYNLIMHYFIWHSCFYNMEVRKTTFSYIDEYINNCQVYILLKNFKNLLL